ncbi:hypothetical protein [Nitrosopumilus cobalaminigenes]|nr:hypothetical protein [Nitrosopumilus cobalaminigenes]
METDSPEEYNILIKLLKKYPQDTEMYNPCNTRDLQLEAGRLTVNRTWDELSNLGNRLRARSNSDWNLFLGEYEVRKTLREFGCNICGTGGPYDKLSSNLKDEEFRAKVAAELEKQGKPPELIDKVISAVDGEFKNKLKDILRYPMHFISLRSQFSIALGYTGLLSGFHSVFNKHFSVIDIPTFERKEIDFIKKLIDEFQEKNILGLLEIHSAFSLGDREKIRNISTSVFNEQESTMKWYAIVSATIAKAVTSYISEDPSLARAFGKLEHLLSHAVRSWILTSVVAMYGKRIALLRDDDDEFEDEIKMARKLAFNSKIPNGKNITIRELYNNSDENDGKYLEINGFVKDIAIQREGEKLLTVFKIYEPGKDEEIPGVVIFENMPRHGMVNNGFIKMHGTWKKDSNVVDYPVFQVERINLTELSKESWYDYILMKVRPWFDFYPNSNHVEWSIRPQEEWNPDVENLNTGAGELIFIKPFTQNKVIP